MVHLDDARNVFGTIARSRQTVDKALVREWCDALRSGKFVQKRQMLCGDSGEGVEEKLGFCCLGVAAEVFGPRCGVTRVKSSPYDEYAYHWAADNEQNINHKTAIALPEPVRKLLGFYTSNPRLLRPSDGKNDTASGWNDAEYATFAEIADMLEYTYLKDNGDE